MNYINVTEALNFLQDALTDAELVNDTTAIESIKQAITLLKPLAA